MHDVPSPLVLCDLGCSVVLVCPGIERLDLSMLQLPLEDTIISGIGLEILKDILLSLQSEWTDEPSMVRHMSQ